MLSDYAIASTSLNAQGPDCHREIARTFSGVDPDHMNVAEHCAPLLAGRKPT